MNILGNPLAISVGLVTIALLTAYIAGRSRRDRGADLGAVSTQWVMEHRTGPEHDSSRWNQR